MRKVNPPKVPAAQPTIVKAVVAPPKDSGRRLMETQHQPANKDMKDEQKSLSKNVQMLSKDKNEERSKPEFKREWP